MMTFIRIPARDVRPGALVMIDHVTHKNVYAVREIIGSAGTLKFTFADAPHFGNHYDRDDMLWVAQRA